MVNKHLRKTKTIISNPFFKLLLSSAIYTVWVLWMEQYLLFFGILIIADIHWSKEMQQAWDTIKNHYQVTLSIDIYQMGIVFFNPEIRKQDYILAY